MMAVADPAKGSHGGISCFMVDMKSPGIEITAKDKTMVGHAF